MRENAFRYRAVLTGAAPGRVRYFARSIVLLAKTDVLDAHLLPHYGEASQPYPVPLLYERQQTLAASGTNF